MIFIIFHGSFGSPEGNWFPELKEQLEALGQTVLSPQFPVEDYDVITKKGPNQKLHNQNLENWLEFFSKNILPKLKKSEKICFVGHSIGPIFILHAVNKFQITLDSAIFVSPFMEPSTKHTPWQYQLVNSSFYKTDFDFNKLKKLIPVSYVLYSDNDPYVPKKYSIDFAQKLESSTIMVKQAGHLNSEVNLNEFPLVLELCKTRLNLSLYQKYLSYRNRLLSPVSMRVKHEEIIYMNPQEGYDEGIFHFRNLKKGGFCTLYTELDYWNSESKYMEEARRCVKRTGNLTRVMILDNKEDLKKDIVIKQMELDIKAGIKVLYCLYEDIKNEVSEPDFGIWDDDYVCIVGFDKAKKVNEVKLSSRKADLEKAKKWEKYILSKARVL